MLDYLNKIQEETFDNLFSYYEDEINDNPEQLLKKIEAELNSMYVRSGNDWTGRGEIGNAKLDSAIAALEAVRAECISQTKKLSGGIDDQN